MIQNYFKTVTNYQEMLDKISISTFVVLYICLYQVSCKITWIYNYIQNFISIEMWGVKLPIAVLIVSVILTYIFRSVKLHDRISDILKIRTSYDFENILIPLAKGSGFNLNEKSKNIIKNNRIILMDKIFYKYTSSANLNPGIDKHLINMAMDQWSWYWSLVEAIFCLYVTAIILLFSCNIDISLIFLIAASIGLLFTHLLIKYCIKYTKREIDAILDNQSYKKEILGYLNAL